MVAFWTLVAVLGLVAVAKAAYQPSHWTAGAVNSED